MPRLVWVKNNSKVQQSWGRYSIEPGMAGLVPAEAVVGGAGQRNPDFTVLSDNPETWLFRRTEHQPSNPRYLP